MHTTKKYLALVLTGLGVVYIALQFIAPTLNASLELDFEQRCYSGDLQYIDRIGSSCSGSGESAVGFPFVINNVNNSFPEKVFVGLVDIVPLALIMLVLWKYKLNS